LHNHLLACIFAPAVCPRLNCSMSEFSTRFWHPLESRSTNSQYHTRKFNYYP